LSAKSYFFASDFHLGAPNSIESLIREKDIVRWLNHIESKAEEIFLVGDIFDFWFEYKHAIPKGFIRLQGKIAELTDKGIPVHLFTGNHDMWMFDYFPDELGVQIHRNPTILNLHNQKVFVGHGDGLGPGDKSYKFLKRIFQNKLCQWAFARIHPNLGISLATLSSRSSRKSNGNSDAHFNGKEKEWLYSFCMDFLQKEAIDTFIFGHRHLPLEIDLINGAKYLNLGDWIQYNTFVEITPEGSCHLQQWKDDHCIPFQG
jgi:UDP-2,3-diacylglucosamine hydrolase